MHAPNRRELIRAIGLGAIGGFSWAHRSPVIAEHDLEEIARRILRTPRAQIFDLAETLVRAGLDWRDLEAAIFLAGVLEIRPRPAGQRLHAVLVVESVYQLAEASPEEERLRPVLFNLDDVKASQDGDAAGPDWSLARCPDVRTRDRSAARAEFARAFEAWDAERADQAIVDLLALDDLEAALEIAWRQAIRDLGSLGHKVIYAAQAERTLRRVGGIFVEPTMRSLAFSLTEKSRSEDLADHRGSVELARAIPEGWRGGDARPDESLELARAFVKGTPDEARAKLLAALVAGASASTGWDAVRLASCELFARGPGLLPVHPTTIANALHHIHRSTTDEATRRVSLLQAAAWTPRLREALADRGNISRTTGAMDELVAAPDEDVESLEDVLAAPSTRRVMSHLSRADRIEPFTARLRTNLFRGVDQNHQPKYAAAVLEDMGLCHPRWRPVLLAPSLGYLPSAGTPSTAVHERSSEILTRLRKG